MAAENNPSPIHALVLLRTEGTFGTYFGFWIKTSI
jgi:hypothetical protein